MGVNFADPDALFLPREVAEFCHTTEGALAQERWRGQGPRYVKLGKRVMYRAGDLAAFISAHIVTPGAEAPQMD